MLVFGDVTFTLGYRPKRELERPSVSDINALGVLSLSQLVKVTHDFKFRIFLSRCRCD